MLPLAQKIAFLVFAGITGGFGTWGFYRLYRRIRAGRADADARWDRLPARVWYALTTTLMQSRTFRKRPVVSFFHSLIFYGFVFYILVNFVDALEGYVPVSILSGSWWGAAYNLSADVLSALVNLGYQRPAAEKAIEQAVSKDEALAGDFDGLFRGALKVIR